MYNLSIGLHPSLRKEGTGVDLLLPHFSSLSLAFPSKTYIIKYSYRIHAVYFSWYYTNIMTLKSTIAGAMTLGAIATTQAQVALDQTS
jgi:hypothetical protein